MPSHSIDSPLQILTLSARRAAIGCDGAGLTFLATITASTAGHTLRVEPLDAALRADGAVGDSLTVTRGAMESVCLSHDEIGRVVAVWTQVEPDGLKLCFALRLAPGQWTPPSAISTLFGSCLAPALARDARGRVWCAFQSNSTGRHHIFISWMSKGLWAFPQRISDGDGHCFAPALCVFGEGVRVVWDGRVDGRYAIFMREVDDTERLSRREPQATLAQSDTLLANATILALDDERSLVAYEQAQPGWGQRNVVRRASRLEMTSENYLHARRDLRTMLLGPEGGAELAGDLNATLDQAAPAPSRGQPTLAMDNQGAIWLAYRQIQDIQAAEGESGFVQALTRYQQGQWTAPILLPDTGAGCTAPLSLATAGDGPLLAACVQRKGWRNFIHVFQLPSPGPAGPLSAQPFAPLPITRPADPKPARTTTAQTSAGPARLLWGDIHRHSDSSLCRWWLEGSPIETYRYALMAAELDFFALTDHAVYLQTPDTVAENHNLANAFNLPGIFTAFCAYEGNFTGQGHMVVLTDQATMAIPAGKDRSAVIASLNPEHMLAVPHHMGDPEYPYPWAGHDDAVGPVAEIYQPYRTSFEALNAPSPKTGWQSEGKQIVAESTMLAAWQAGHKIGVLASSDHLATGGAFAGVWARANTRSEILRAIRRRHCYAASDRIELAFWADGHFMGDSYTLSAGCDASTVTFKVRLRGTAALDAVELLQDGQVIHTFHPAPSAKAHSRPADPACLQAELIQPVPSGEHFYYLRVRQCDGNMAWTSPIWITA